MFYRFVQLCWTLLSLSLFSLSPSVGVRKGRIRSGRGHARRQLEMWWVGGAERRRAQWPGLHGSLPAFHESYARVGLASKVRNAGLGQSVEREWSGWWQQCARRWLALSRSQQGPVPGKTDAGWQAIEARRVPDTDCFVPPAGGKLVHQTLFLRVGSIDWR